MASSAHDLTRKSGLAATAGPDFAPSGRQFQLVHGDQRAVVVEVGGGVRSYRVGGRDVLDPYPANAMCDGARGTPLVPWPNRLADGKYTFDGVEYQLPLSEPATHNAIHGLTRWRNWAPREQTASSVVMGIVIAPMAGFPFCLDVTVAYQLDDEGLRVTTSAMNIGPNAAPWACGAHPYLSPGDGVIDDAVLEFNAALRVETDDRQLPRAETAVAGTEYDFASARKISDTQIDHAFKNVARDADGRAHATLTGADGRAARLWCDASYPVMELYTGDQLRSSRRRHGLGVEPMSAPPNAFSTGESVLRLESGATTTHVWGVRLVG